MKLRRFIKDNQGNHEHHQVFHSQRGKRVQNNVLFTFILVIGLASINSCKDKGTNPEDQVFTLPDSNLTYIDHIRPMFVAKCTSRSGCHSTVDQAGGLDLTNYQDIRQHMVNGSIPLVFSGDGENSILYQILLTSYLDRPRMPIDGPYLNTNNSRGVKTWIDEGLNYTQN